MGLVLPGGRGKVTSGGEIGGPQGASDPQGRVSEPLKHMTRAAGWSASCPPELRAALLGGGGGAGAGSPVTMGSCPSLSQDPAHCPAPRAALILGVSPRCSSTTCTHTQAPQSPPLSPGSGRYTPRLLLVRIATDLKVKERKGEGCRGERPACAERPHVPGASRREREAECAPCLPTLLTDFQQLSKGRQLLPPPPASHPPTRSRHGPLQAPTTSIPVPTSTITPLPRTFLYHEAKPLTEMVVPTPPLPPSLTFLLGHPSPQLHPL